MKEITLIVPDEIDHMLGTRNSTRTKSENVTPDNLTKALCDRSDYHETYFFKYSGEVEIVDCDE